PEEIPITAPSETADERQLRNIGEQIARDIEQTQGPGYPVTQVYQPTEPVARAELPEIASFPLDLGGGNKDYYAVSSQPEGIAGAKDVQTPAQMLGSPEANLAAAEAIIAQMTQSETTPLPIARPDTAPPPEVAPDFTSPYLASPYGPNVTPPTAEPSSAMQ